jgi:3-deoxy-D-manno-octulosonate 8-phosphate phosphatase (KDO 8-P phosphatase)
VIQLEREVARAIRLVVLDVDGVLTNAHLVLGVSGEEIKAFNVRDGIGIKVAQFAGIEVAFLSARVSEIVKSRARMLGVTELRQGEQHKLKVVREMAERRGIALSQVAYVGDDLVDMESIQAVGVGVAVGDACVDLLAVAPFVTSAPGGRGAVREAIEAIIRARGDWEEVRQSFLVSLE